MTTFPEIEAALVRAAEQRKQRPRSFRHNRLLVTLVAGTTLGGAAVAGALIGTQDHPVAEGPIAVQGPRGERLLDGRYAVKATVTTGGKVCVSVNIVTPDTPTGRPSRCVPSDITAPIQQLLFTVAGADDRRLLTGIVSDDVAAVAVKGRTETIDLRRFSDTPGGYFAVLVPRSSVSPVLVARDRDGQEIARFDTAAAAP